MSECARCRERGQTWPGDAPRCAFADGVAFSQDNWNCATMNDLRDLAERLGYRQRHDDRSAALLPLGFVETGYDPTAYVQDGEGWPYIVLGWYKDRGATEEAWELNSFPGDPPPVLTLAHAELILKHAPSLWPER